MRIAILTLPLHSNYGGILQAYALQTVLERMGHDVVILQKDKWNVPGRKLWKRYIRRFGKKLLKDWSQEIFIEKRRFREKPIIKQHLDKFVKHHLNTKIISSLLDFNFDSVDAIVVGSDQIWRKPYFTSMWERPIQDAYLDLISGKSLKRLSYAASFGLDNIDEYNSNEIKMCQKAIAFFDAVGVREESGVDICRTMFGVKAVHTLDPTMLLSKDDYVKLIPDNSESVSGELLTYILDASDEKSTMIEKISKELNYRPFSINHPENDESVSLKNRIQPSMEKWLQGFRDAKFVVTDSFHACVFSIIFNKPFVVIGNCQRGMSRFQSLLSQFRQANRLSDGIYKGDEWLNGISEAPNVPITDFRNSSIAFLQDNLK